MTTATCGGCDARWTGHRTEHCPVCHQTFSTTRAGDRHRVGPFDPPDRRCLTPDEMREAGMRQNARGVWTSGGTYWTGTPDPRTTTEVPF